MIKVIERYPVLSLLVVVLLVMLPGLEQFKITVMEARNFITAREMLTKGNWFLTTMNGVPCYEKPPLPTWITALFGLLFGIKNIFALRLPGVLMLWITGTYTYLFSKVLSNNRRNSFINGLIIVTSFYVIGIVEEAPWDIYTHGFMLAAIYYLYKVYKTTNKWNFLWASFFIVCSIMSKGSVSLYALLLPFLLAYALVYGINKFFIKTTVLVLVPGLILGSIWFMYVRLADTDTFFKIALVKTANWSSSNVKSFYYYWDFFLQSVIWIIPALLSLFYPYMIKKGDNKEVYKLSFFWTILSVVLLSLIPEQKTRYLMPILIPLAINTGYYLHYVLEDFNKMKSKVEKLPVYFHFGLLGLSAVLFPLVAFILFEDRLLANKIIFLICCLGLLLLGSFLFFYLYFKVLSSAFYTSVAIVLLLFVVVVPLNPDFTNQNINCKSISTLKSEAATENIKLYYLDLISPEMLWDYGEIIPKIPEVNGVYKMPCDERFGVLVMDSELITNSTLASEYVIEHKETYDLNFGKFKTRKHYSQYVSNYYIFQKKVIKK